MWNIIKLSEEDEFDVIPSSWVISTIKCYFPKGSLTYIKALVKNNANPDPEWDICHISIVESDIDDYDAAMKMMFRAAKNMSLFSDNEKGRGLRQKKPSKIYCDMTDFENEPRNEPSKTNKCRAVPQIPDYPSVPFEAAEVNTSSTPPNSKASSNKERQMSKCGIRKCHIKSKHNCTFDDDEEEDLLISIAHQLCKLSVELAKIKANVKYLKEESVSSERAPQLHAQEVEANDQLFCFPIGSDTNLKNIETTLVEHANVKKLITMLVQHADGKSMPKVVGSIMTRTITSQFAALYSWKGQKNKKPFQNLELAKAIVVAVSKKCEKDTTQDIIKSIQLWLAQSPARLKRAQEAEEKKRQE